MLQFNKINKEHNDSEFAPIMTKIPSTVARSLRPAGIERGSQRMNTWQSVRSEVLERIRTREWAPGELIPTEQQLAVQLGCARATVNRALRELADSGIVERRRKVGTRVTSTPSRRTTLEMPVVRDEIEALYLADGHPHCCEAIWLNPRSLPTITIEDVRNQPAHEWLARNVPLTRGRFSILAEGASGDCAHNLRVENGTPVLAVERINWSDVAPVSFSRQFYPPRHRLVSED